MEQVYARLTDRAHDLRTRINAANSGQPARILIALAGPPGSGKSTVAAEIVRRLNAESSNQPYAAILPMDGFHLTRASLEAMPNREEAIARRGVHWTFDANKVVDLVTKLHDTRSNLTVKHFAPSFDHATKDPVENSIEIDSSIRLVILEGNWLLYHEHPWSKISKLVDDTWFIDVEPNLALRRVAQRHMESGVEASWDKALYRAKNNDVINGELVRSKLVQPAIRVESVELQRA